MVILLFVVLPNATCILINFNKYKLLKIFAYYVFNRCIYLSNLFYKTNINDIQYDRCKNIKF